MKAEAELLRLHGHEVSLYERTNAEIEMRNLLGKIKAFCSISWSREGYRDVANEIRRLKPDIIHVHNYKFLLSPSIFGAAKDLGVPTVLTLHNYRLACPNGQFLRNGRICEDCLRGFPYRMLFYRCSSQNVIKNAAQFYLFWGTRRKKMLTPWVDAYIALSEFGKSRFVDVGLPFEKVFVKPNFIEEPLTVPESSNVNGGAIFIGRLSKEKGVDVLIDAWRGINYPLKVVGNGPLFPLLCQHNGSQVEFAGGLSHKVVIDQIAKADFLVFPSVGYEGFGLTLIEAMALGKPVIATDLGPRREMVRDGYNGFLYAPNDVQALRAKVRMMIENADLREMMGRNAREFYRTHYTPEINYKQLVHIYQKAITFNKMH